MIDLFLLLFFSNIDIASIKVAHAVAIVETNNCKAGVGRFNNCFGIRNGSIAPCEQVSESGFCKYDHPAQSYVAFYRIWVEGYGGGYPTQAQAIRYTNNPNTDWHNKVKNLIK